MPLTKKTAENVRRDVCQLARGNLGAKPPFLRARAAARASNKSRTIMEYKKLLKYPHLGPEDSAIWDRFIEKNPGVYRSVEYDVKVGEGRDYSGLPEDEYSADLKFLSKKRIDVVGFTDKEIHVIELKPSAGLSALGQALGLSELYRKAVPTDKRVVGVVITDQILPDMEALCAKSGVWLFQA